MNSCPLSEVSERTMSNAENCANGPLLKKYWATRLRRNPMSPSEASPSLSNPSSPSRTHHLGTSAVNSPSILSPRSTRSSGRENETRSKSMQMRSRTHSEAFDSAQSSTGLVSSVPRSRADNNELLGRSVGGIENSSKAGVEKTPPSSAPASRESTGGPTDSEGAPSSPDNETPYAMRRCDSDAVGIVSIGECRSPSHRRRRMSDSYDSLARPLFRSYLLRDIAQEEELPILTVVLDLDETLVSNRRVDLPFAIVRPYALHVLNALQHMRGLEVVMWTASTRETAEPVVAQLVQGGAVFHDVIYRNEAWFTEPIHTKDLRLLGRDMNRLMIVDNAANCCKFNKQNSLLIEDFFGVLDEEDAALVNVYYTIERVLDECARGGNVGSALQRLAVDGSLCHTEVYDLPESWQRYPLENIAPLKIPPHGAFVRANTPPPTRSIMQHWTPYEQHSMRSHMY